MLGRTPVSTLIYRRAKHLISLTSVPADSAFAFNGSPRSMDLRHVYHLCVARVPDRDAFRNRVPFDTGVHYPRALTQQPAYEQFVRSPCPQAERWAAECVSFPCFPEMTDDEIEAVCRAIR